MDELAESQSRRSSTISQIQGIRKRIKADYLGKFLHVNTDRWEPQERTDAFELLKKAQEKIKWYLQDADKDVMIYTDA